MLLISSGPVGTPYQGGIFRCRLVFGQDFPQHPPKGNLLFLLTNGQYTSTNSFIIHILYTRFVFFVCECCDISGVMLTKIFHPNVSKAGEICGISYLHLTGE